MTIPELDAQAPSTTDVPDGYKLTELGVLPEEWDIVRLDDVVKLRSKAIKPEEAQDLPYVGLEHIDSGDFLLRRHGHASEVKSNKSLFFPGDVLYGKLRPYLDKAVLVERDGICSTDILVLSSTEGIDSEFLAQVVHTPFFVGHAIATTTGANHPRTSWSSVSECSIPLPPFEEQRSIASVLRTVQRAKEATEQVINSARELKRSLMNHLFTYGPVSVEDADQVPLKETEIGPVPEHWITMRIGDVAKVGNGSTPKRTKTEYWEGGSFPWLTSGKVHEGVIKEADEFVTPKALESCHLPLVPAGSVVVAITGQGKTLGNSALLALDATINQHLAYIKLNDGRVIPEFLHSFLQTRYEDLRIVGHPGGSTKGALTCGFLKTYVVPVPPLEEQHEIVLHLSALDQKIAAEENRKRTLDTLFKSLLHDLMIGKVRVGDVNLTEMMETV